jgi:exopolyphosphatase/guanosine-5'-triphosphate,3'-diphosphate pyrophosphatase
MSRECVEGLFGRLKAMTHYERAAMEALEDGRADLIIPGTIIVLQAMAAFGFNEMVVSDYGLLEGLLIDLAEREGHI